MSARETEDQVTPLQTIRLGILYARALRLTVVPSIATHGIKRNPTPYLLPAWLPDEHEAVDPLGAAVLSMGTKVSTTILAAICDALKVRPAYAVGFSHGCAYVEPDEIFTRSKSRQLYMDAYADGIRVRTMLDDEA